MFDKSVAKKVFILVLAFGIILLAACAPPPKPEEKAPPPEKKPPEEKPAPPPPKEKIVYTGTVYVAGMGGHFAVAEVEIDPTNEEEPIKIKNLNRITLMGEGGIYGTKMATHDPRIDYEKHRMYYTTYVDDGTGHFHYGYVDLKTGEVKVDKKFKIPEGAKKPFGCASGQTPKYFVPTIMSYPGFILVIDKETMEVVRKVDIPTTDPFPKAYCWYHGYNSPDYKYYLLTVTECEEGNNFKTATGRVFVFLLDLNALVEKGEIKLVKDPLIIKGEAMKTANFRGYFTPDGKYVLQSGRDRFFVIDVEKWEVYDEKILTAEGLPEGSEAHDVMPIDNRYALVTIRLPIEEAGKKVKDGTILLYDIQNKRIIGKPVSTCKACHAKIGVGVGKSAILCGIDGHGTFKKTTVKE